MRPEKPLALLTALAAAMLLISGTAGVALAAGPATPAPSGSPDTTDMLGKDGPSGDDVTSLYVQGDQPYTVFGEIDEETGVDIAEAILEE